MQEAPALDDSWPYGLAPNTRRRLDERSLKWPAAGGETEVDNNVYIYTYLLVSLQ